MTRIIAGRYRGLRLHVPVRGTRPTSEKVREAVFSTLTHTGLLEDGRIADLCAGSGALGLEALSRGAAHVDFVDAHRRAAAVIRTNLVHVDAHADARIYPQTLRQFFDHHHLHPWDIVFLDPPYDQAATLTAQTMAAIAAGDLLARGGLMVVEAAKTTRITPVRGWQVWKEKTYGDTAVCYLERAAVA
ncbi:MAG: 16S rRNA (guanine(966)-N(2))-methyltransferase RsmD [Bowdeniella nasicola]|nr:16S rRNA (guanine(966)-N(2))-methyltransferase RsmD [Bowdeniella nasicola]